MIMKFLLVVAVIGIVYFFFIKKKPTRTIKSKKDKKSTKTDANDMVECEECGLYVELGETIISNNRYYCSSECVDKA